MLKSRDSTLLTKVHIVKAMVFSNSHARMWELDHKQGWVLKNSCFWIVVLEKTLESPLDYKEIKPVNPKGNQSWIFTGRTDAEAPIIWPPHVKSQLTGKDPDAGKDWWQEDEQGGRGWVYLVNLHSCETTFTISPFSFRKFPSALIEVPLMLLCVSSFSYRKT